MDKIINFYDQDANYEWNRLQRHRTEFALTLKCLEEWFVSGEKCKKILDIGGGPGRYAIELAKWGHHVSLIDLSPQLIEKAKEKSREIGVVLPMIQVGNALDLSSLPAEHFDIVLIMGPFYHLLTEAERSQALKEAKRVLKPKGLIFATFLSRFASIRHVAASAPEQMKDKFLRDIEEEVLKSGIYTSKKKLSCFTDAYFCHPSMIIPFFEKEGFQKKDLIGVEGCISEIEEKVNTLSESDWDWWVEINYQLGHEPSLIGASSHILYVGEKE
ncbi:MAG: class I SAM-dependent methyltransferase [Oligoflexia bacterium]|nr:class I SAM-dependent methyltransferase [Oligoflexia bacterium]MBF0365296.1 class I SAM-dependent methyltransferase [Oligoflexia bacterium]